MSSSSMTAPLSSAFKPINTVSALAKRFEPVVLQAPELETDINNFDYVSKMNIERNAELDSGSTVRYDVQPDTRFFKNYVEQNISSLYPEMNIKGHPLVSIASLAGYDFTILYAFLLGCDIHHRNGMSYWAKKFYTDAKKKELYNELLDSRLPSYVTEFLLTLAPVYDPRRSDHLLVPSLAGYSHLHDFGRTFPPMIYFLAHHVMATTSTRKQPGEYQRDIYEQNIVTYNTQPFRIANFFGYYSDDENTVHANWVNEDFESFLNPVVGRTLQQRPTFGKMNFHVPTYAAQNAFDTYEYFLSAQDNNIDTTLKVIRALSNFQLAQDPKSPKLGQVLASLSGALLFSHSVEGPTLPTWTGLTTKKAKLTDDTFPDSSTHEEWAKKMNYLVESKAQTGKIPNMKDESGLIAKLYLVIKKAFNKDDNPAPVILFSEPEHVTPYVLHFQPHDVSSSAIALHVIAGLKIESAEIDGFSIPSPNGNDSLDDNNSQYLQAAVRLSNITPIFASAATGNNHYRFWQRTNVDKEDQKGLIIFRNHGQNQKPSIGNENVVANDEPAWDDVGVFNDTRVASNIRSHKNGTLNYDKTKVIAWSSYRVVHKYNKPLDSDISMITSFRPIYGLNVTLSRTKNPALLIPH